MDIVIIAAVSRNGIIGKDGTIPWKLSGDMKRFREATTGKTVIMGRKTFESIGKPLPNRKNIVLSSTLKPIDGITICRSLREALAMAENEAFICGGFALYAAAMPLATKMVLTVVETKVTGDTRFPSIPNRFEEISRTQFPSDEKNEYPCTVIEYRGMTDKELKERRSY
jgi:dihydrofolate reductase